MKQNDDFFNFNELFNSIFKNDSFFMRGYSAENHTDITKYPDYKKVEETKDMGAFNKITTTETWTENGCKCTRISTTMGWKENGLKLKQLETDLKKAVADENYIEAAKLQEQIKQLKTGN